MSLSAVKAWFGRQMRTPWESLPPPLSPSLFPKIVPLLAAVASSTSTRSAPTPPPPAWMPDRLMITDILWGDGYQFPGGEIETLRLARPMGLSKASSLLLIGAGGGGAACSLAVQLGVWVSGFEADSHLAAVAIDRIARRKVTKHAQIEVWNPEAPKFREHFYHHGLALEPLHGSQPERTLSAIATALKPAGHLVLVELVADSPLDPADPIVTAWARLERRDPGALPSAISITRILGRLGFDVRVEEDVSERHASQALTGWRTTVRIMEDVRPTRRAAMRYVQEAELWILRLRLLRTGQLRLVRWHAIGGG
jgi:cyclopropane fatty-acyl-phospholipid synthase-like methyltransferase